jgi:ABC-2 type transport system permease protein
MLALEGQIYESDAQNAELAQAGKIDFVFIISALSPLIIILLFHDLFANERNSGRHDLLVSTSISSFSLWGARSIVRFLALFVCLMLPFYIGAAISSVSVTMVVAISAIVLVYMLLWTLLSIWWAQKQNTAPRIASSLIGIWVLFAFIIPILGDLAINHSVHSPKGGDIVLTQREAVNDGWDLPKEATLKAFVETHPEYKDNLQFKNTWAWNWYYAFQQVGDQTAAELSQAYRDASQRKYELAGWVSLLSPPMLVQRSMTRMAETDALAAFEYEQQIRDFHKALRMFYYPFMFGDVEFEKQALNEMPDFEVIKTHVSK